MLTNILSEKLLKMQEPIFFYDALQTVTKAHEKVLKILILLLKCLSYGVRMIEIWSQYRKKNLLSDWSSFDLSSSPRLDLYSPNFFHVWKSALQIWENLGQKLTDTPNYLVQSYHLTL